jgi:hypothetical protein
VQQSWLYSGTLFREHCASRVHSWLLQETILFRSRRVRLVVGLVLSANLYCKVNVLGSFQGVNQGLKILWSVAVLLILPAPQLSLRLLVFLDIVLLLYHFLHLLHKSHFHHPGWLVLVDQKAGQQLFQL